MKRPRILHTALAFVLALGIASTWSGASASEPIKLLIAAPAGGGTDSLFRALARQVGEELGATVVLVNLPAAGGSTVIDQVMRAPANGTTIGALANSTLTSTPHVMKVGFGPNDYLPVIQISSAAYAMCVGPGFPAKTAAEFVRAMKVEPGRYTVATDPGIGQLAAGRILKALGVDARLVPFKGASESVVAFLGGHVDVYQGSIPVILPHVASGKARCVLVTGTQRSPRLPDAASLTELGISGEATTLTRVVVVNKETPAAVVNRIARAFEVAANSADVRNLLDSAGDSFVVVQGRPLAEALRREYDDLGAVAKRLGLVP